MTRLAQGGIKAVPRGPNTKTAVSIISDQDSSLYACGIINQSAKMPICGAADWSKRRVAFQTLPEADKELNR